MTNLDSFTKLAYNEGVAAALADAGLVKEANVFLKGLETANKASGTAGQQALQMGLGAGMGSLAAGEGNRGWGAILGAGAGWGAGKFNRMRAAGNIANPKDKLKAMADSYKNMSKLSPEGQRAANLTMQAGGGIMAGAGGLGAGIGLNMMT